MPEVASVLAAKYSMGVVTVPTSMTLIPLAARPRTSAAANAGPLRRPSRPTATVFSPAASARLPNAWPSPNATASLMVDGTTPRMS